MRRQNCNHPATNLPNMVPFGTSRKLTLRPHKSSKCKKRMTSYFAVWCFVTFHLKNCRQTPSIRPSPLLMNFYMLTDQAALRDAHQSVKRIIRIQSRDNSTRKNRRTCRRRVRLDNFKKPSKGNVAYSTLTTPSIIRQDRIAAT